MRKTIEELQNTIDELKSRLPDLRDNADELVTHAKKNPLPYAVTGLGLAATLGQVLKSTFRKPQPPSLGERVSSAAHSAKESVVQFADGAREKFHDASEAVVDKAGGLRGRITDRNSREPSTVAKVRDVVTENPFLCGAGVIATGFVVGLLIPPSRRERQWFGQTGRQIIDDAKAAGRGAVEEGKALAKETIAAADSVVRDATKDTKEAISEKLAEADSAVRDAVKETGRSVRSNLADA